MLPGFPSLSNAPALGPLRQIQLGDDGYGNGGFKYDQLNEPTTGTLSGSLFRTAGDTRFLQIQIPGGTNTGYFDLYNVGSASPFAIEALTYKALYVAGVRYPISWGWVGNTLRGTNPNRFGLATAATRSIQLGP